MREGNRSWPVFDDEGVKIGQIVWNAAGQSLDAHCSHDDHQSEHLRCHVNRTVKPSRGKGRPLAFLISWLRCGRAHGSRDGHFQARLGRGEAAEEVSFETRSSIRALIINDSDWDEARALERAPLANEGPEPRPLP